jgi:hypothetical protein
MMSNVPAKDPRQIHDNGSCFVVKDKARPTLGGQIAQQRRGAADRGKYC